MLISPTQDKLYYAVQLFFQQGKKVSNNIAEYEGLIAGLKDAAALGVKHLIIKGDSQLLVNFSNKVYEPKDEHMDAYLAEVRRMEKQFWGLELPHVPHGTNQEADDIARRASRRLPQEPSVFEERSSSHRRHCHYRAQRNLGRNSLNHLPQEPRPVARPREHTYSWRWSLRRDAGPRNSGTT